MSWQHCHALRRISETAQNCRNEGLGIGRYMWTAAHVLWEAPSTALSLQGEPAMGESTACIVYQSSGRAAAHAGSWLPEDAAIEQCCQLCRPRRQKAACPGLQHLSLAEVLAPGSSDLSTLPMLRPNTCIVSCFTVKSPEHSIWAGGVHLMALQSRQQPDEGMCAALVVSNGTVL